MNDPAPRPMLTRRRLLVGGGAIGVLGMAGVAVGVQQEVLPGRARIYRKLGINGAEGVVPDVAPGPTRSGTFASAARGKDLGWTIATPPGVRPDQKLPVVIFLHGTGDDHASVFDRDKLGLDLFLADTVNRGTPPFALATVDGDSSFWYDRSDGDRAGTMVTEEFLPLLASEGLAVDRVAFVGTSMGGYGGLHLARLLGPDRVAAVGALSPSLWLSREEALLGAFPTDEDFERTTPIGRQEDLHGIRIRVDCGQSDSYYYAAKEYVEGFPSGDRPSGGFELGNHAPGYWRRMLPAQLSFVGEALAQLPEARCRSRNLLWIR